MKLKFLSLLLWPIIFSISKGQCDTLSLQDFLKQVEDKNQSITASKLSLESAGHRENENNLIFRPNIFVQAQTAVEKKPTANINIQGDRTDNSYFTAGVLQQFNFGLQGKLSYTMSHTQIYNASPIMLPQNNFYDGNIGIELTQSLWKNFLGNETQSTSDIIKAQREASKHTENFKIKSLLANSEAGFWSLAQLNKVLKVQEENLERALKLKKWSQNRFNTGLGEKSDLLQAEANFKAREYEYLITAQDQKNLQRTLNGLRGQEGDQFSKITELTTLEILKLPIPMKAKLREDTLAAFEYNKMAQANSSISIEKNKPTFDIYGTYILNGRNRDKGQAVTNTFKTNHDTTVLGIKFMAPIDFLSAEDNITGHKLDQIAAEQNFQRKLFEQDEQWADLNSKLEDAKIKLSAFEKIVETQKIKVLNERERLKKGRTVTFQVLNFEQDYAQSQLAKIQIENTILNIHAQLKTFSIGDNE